MPQLIEHIDSISRQKQRDVLFLRFVSSDSPDAEDDDISLFPDDVDWEHLECRRLIIDWLDQQNIVWQPCGDIASENCMDSYRGQIYIDVPYDETLAEYRQLKAFLENPDGSMRFPEVEFWRLTYERAMKNAHHDEPGFWDRWAENF